MKRDDIVVGNTYETKVSGRRTLVVVLGFERSLGGTRKERWKVRVKRADNGLVLNNRDPSAIHSPNPALLAKLVSRETKLG